jgi:HSP20 family protein
MEDAMNLRTLVPFSGRGNLARPDLGLFGSLQREVDSLFEEFTRGLSSTDGRMITLMPSLDVSESDKEIEIRVDLPGLERKDVDISIENDLLTIRGEKKFETSEDDKAKNYHVRERSYGAFYRVLQLPPGINSSNVQATMSKGVLTITIPKPAQSAAKKIEVKEAA